MSEPTKEACEFAKDICACLHIGWQENFKIAAPFVQAAMDKAKQEGIRESKCRIHVLEEKLVDTEKDRDMWKRVAQDENTHADLVQTMQKGIESGAVTPRWHRLA